MIELKLKRIARKKGYTIGRLYLPQTPTPDPSQREGRQNHPRPLQKGGVDTAQSPSPLGGAGGGCRGWGGCDTLEPECRRGKKIKGRTAIPEGRYPVVVTWSPRFKRWLPLLLGVPGFSGIRIHAGNSPEDTKGCILVGENRRQGMVLNSRPALDRLMKLLDAREEGEPCFITVE